jgi:hypothetical protein
MTAEMESYSGILDYWGGGDVASLLLMPVTRHQIIHMNEALEIKRKVSRLA